VQNDSADVAVIAAAIARAPLVAFDLEFLAQDRLVPTLCLVQVAWRERTAGHDDLDAAPGPTGAPRAPEPGDPTVRLIDPLAVDVAPVIQALAAHPCVIAHAPRQDLALLATRFGGLAIPSVIDTQVMAAFAGMGDQIGFAALANDLLGLALGKEQQWTDWGARPLSDAQLTYAAADVRYLPAIYDRLAARLGERLAWARAESADVAAEAMRAASVTPDTAWQHIGGLRGLDAATLAVVVELARWRQAVCVELDRPLGQVLNDKLIIDLARQRPTGAAAIRGVKGMSGIARQRADDIAGAIAVARPGAVPTLAASRAASLRAQRWTEVLLAIVQLVADQHKLAPRLLATRADAEELARAVDERGLAAADALPAMASWRRDVLGVAWRGWLAGELVLVGDVRAATGVKLEKR
jgi:ribonuclease D